jgi:hypothetical protein
MVLLFKNKHKKYINREQAAQIFLRQHPEAIEEGADMKESRYTSRRGNIKY